jgi:hypothetical protein
VRTDDRPVASGLTLAGRMALPGPAAAVAVGEGAVWVLLQQGTLLRVDPNRHQVTGRLDLEGAASRGVGGLAVGAGAVWVAMREGTVTARIDPVRLQVIARLGGQVVVVADGVLWSYLVRGDKFMGFGRVDAGTLRPRRPLLVTDAAGGHPPIGWFSVGNAAVWTAAFEDRRVWRVPLAGGPARAVTRVPATRTGWPRTPARCGWCRLLPSPAAGVMGAAGCGAWIGVPAWLPRPRRCLRWILAGMVWRSGSPWAEARSGWPARPRVGRRRAASCCGSVRPRAG